MSSSTTREYSQGFVFGLILGVVLGLLCAMGWMRVSVAELNRMRSKLSLAVRQEQVCRSVIIVDARKK